VQPADHRPRESSGQAQRCRPCPPTSAHRSIAGILLRCREPLQRAGNGRYGRRIDARPVFELATLRVHAINRSASGVSVRSLTVMNPTGAGGDDTLTGRILRCIPLPPKRMTEAGTKPSQRPVSGGSLKAIAES